MIAIIISVAAFLLLVLVTSWFATRKKSKSTAEEVRDFLRDWCDENPSDDSEDKLYSEREVIEILYKFKNR